MTPDQSRALALWLNSYPQRRPEVIEYGWSILTPEETEEAEAMFIRHWGRPMREPKMQFGA